MSKINKKHAGAHRNKVFGEVKKNIDEALKLSAEIKNDLVASNNLADLMLSHIDKMNRIWNDNRPAEIKAADEIQPDELVRLLQNWVEREGAGDYEVARQRYIFESTRWKQLNDDIYAQAAQADGLRDNIRGTKRSVILQDGSTLECWVNCQNSDENFDLHGKALRDAHFNFGISLAVLDKRIAAAIVFYDAVRKTYPDEVPRDRAELLN